MNASTQNSGYQASSLTLPGVATAKFWPEGRWGKSALVLLLGYLCIGRTFAYFGIPPLHIFIGEVVLALFLLCGPRTQSGQWPWVATQLQQLKHVLRAWMFFLACGIFQILHGIYLGNPALTSIRDFAFNYYPLYFLIGLWVGLRNPAFLERFFRVFAWFNGLYGLAYVLVLNQISWTLPGVSDDVVPVLAFGLPDYSFLALLGLLAFEPDLRKVWFPLLLNTFVLLGMLIRAEWLALAVGLCVFVWATGRLKHMFIAGGAVVVLLGLMVLADFKMPSPETRGEGQGVISARDLIGRAAAPLHADLSTNYADVDDVQVGTVVWRTIWWAAIWESAGEDLNLALWGHGYGYPLADLVPYLKGQFLRTPHNVFFYALGYSGWVGVILFFWFQLRIFSVLWRVYRGRGQPFGLVFFSSMMIYACFTPFFETPHGAIPFYLVTGIASAGLYRKSPLSQRLSPRSGPGVE